MKLKSEASINDLVDHLFRHNSGQMVSVLTRIFGFQNIDLVEDAIQESLIKALKQWQFKGIPNNPQAWMIQVAKNHILDQFRKNKKLDSQSYELLITLEVSSNENIETKLRYPKELNEDLLCLMFATCHPFLTPDSQIALTLKTVSGFSITEIAKAFLSNKEAVAKMITRAKKKLKKNNVQLQIPPPDQIKTRLDSVLKVLYLMFNEGYSTSNGKELIREDLCYEAIRLAQKLSDHPVTSSPKIQALLALFFFQASRLKTRCNQSRDFLPLAKQERHTWDKKLINVGLYHFKQSAKGNEISNYHLEAEIASCYIFAEDYDSTDWKHILSCYESLLKKKYSPIIYLNKIIILSKVAGVEIALKELEYFKQSGQLKDYFPLFVAIAHLQSENGMFKKSAESYKTALQYTKNETIKRFLESKINELQSFGK